MRAVLVFVGLVVVGLIVWLSTNTNPAPMPGKLRQAASTPTTAVLAPATDAPTPVADRLPAAPVTDTPAANVRVVMFGSEAGVAGVAVHFLRPELDWQKMSEAEQQECVALMPDEAAYEQRYCTQAITDDTGGCYVPPGQNGTDVSARSGTLFAQGHLRADARETMLLVLRQDFTLNILVVDAAGRPAPGVRVQAQRVASSSDPDRQGSALSFDDTDADGRCRQRHIQLLAGTDASCQLDLQAVVPGGAGPAVRIDVTSPPDEVVLHLPAAGAVTVHVRDAEGRPLDLAFLDETRVLLAALDHQPSNPTESIDGQSESFTAQLDARTDAHFPFVSFDRWLSARYRTVREPVGCAGPTLANPSVELTVQEGADDVIVVGTLLLPTDAPYAAQHPVLSYLAENHRGMTTLRTDERGRLRCNLGPGAAGQLTKLHFASRPGTRDAGLFADLPARPLQSGINDLGAVRLAPFGVLVAGRLLCDPGITLQQVAFALEQKHGRTWLPVHNLKTQWQTGRFTVRGDLPEVEALRIRVFDGPYLPVEPIECRSGDTDVEISLRAAGSATASFLIDRDTLPSLLAVRLRRTSPAEPADPERELHWRMRDPYAMTARNGHASTTWGGLEPGSYRLTVECQGSGEPFLSLDAIQIGSGECADPRLCDIDLRGRVRLLEIRATGGYGADITDANAFVLIQGKGETWSGYSLRSGTARIATATSVDLLVLAKDCEMARADGVTASCSIALKPAQQAKLTVALPSPLPEGMQLQLLLLPQLGFPRGNSINLDNGRGMAIDSFFVEEVAVGADGAAEVPVRWPGEYSAEARLQKGGRGGYYLRGFEPRKFTLPGTVALTIEPKGYEQTLQRAVK